MSQWFWYLESTDRKPVYIAVPGMKRLTEFGYGYWNEIPPFYKDE